MLVRDRTKRPVDVRGLANMVTQSKPPQSLPNIVRPILLSNQLRGMDACACSTGLGFYDMETGTTGAKEGSVLGAVAAGSGFIPGVGTITSGVISIFSTAISAFESWLGIGAGRREADLIVPTQNALADRLDQITDGIRIGRNPSVTQLRDYYRELWQLGVGYMEFVLQPVFTDRRAGGQGLNTIMPYINGTCGYPVPLGAQIPTVGIQHNCLVWGDGTLGGPGTDGMMGAVGRAIVSAGGGIPSLPSNVTDAANTGFDLETLPPGGGGGVFETMGLSTGMAVAIGALAVYMWSKK